MEVGGRNGINSVNIETLTKQRRLAFSFPTGVCRYLIIRRFLYLIIFMFFFFYICFFFFFIYLTVYQPKHNDEWWWVNNVDIGITTGDCQF